MMKFGQHLIIGVMMSTLAVLTMDMSDAFAAERSYSKKRRSSNRARPRYVNNDGQEEGRYSLERQPSAEKKKAEKTQENETEAGAEAFDVDSIKKKYWARGDESQLGVVQNRLYKKAGRWSLGFFVGAQFADPFLLVTPVGLTTGYNFSESFGLSLLFFRPIVSESSALKRFAQEKDGNINTNEQHWSLGLETNWSLLYGKLSLVGKKIIYYDMHLTLGGGIVDSDSGRDPFVIGGMGQRFFLNKNSSLRLDYRLQFYREEFFEKTITNQIGNSLGRRNVLGHTVTLGVDFMFGDGS